MGGNQPLKSIVNTVLGAYNINPQNCTNYEKIRETIVELSVCQDRVNNIYDRIRSISLALSTTMDEKGREEILSLIDYFVGEVYRVYSEIDKRFEMLEKEGLPRRLDETLKKFGVL